MSLTNAQRKYTCAIYGKRLHLCLTSKCHRKNGCDYYNEVSKNWGKPNPEIYMEEQLGIR